MAFLATAEALDLSERQIALRFGIHHRTVRAAWEEHFAKLDEATRRRAISTPSLPELSPKPADEEPADDQDNDAEFDPEAAARLAAFYEAQSLWRQANARQGSWPRPSRAEVVR